MQKSARQFAVVAILLAAIGCGRTGQAPTAPSPSASNPDAAPDGSTLKVSAPTPVSPIGGVVVEDFDPDFVFGHAVPTYVDGGLVFDYDLEVYDEDGTRVYNQVLSQSTSAVTVHEIPFDLRENEVHTWRVRARLDEFVGPWSDLVSFKTFIGGPVLPAGPYPPDGGGVVAWVAERYPHLLGATGTFEERTEDMHELRDVIISVGRCGGLDLALNTKANGIISDDAITWKFGPTDGDVEVVDIALDWDNNDNDLFLHWAITEGPAGYTPLPNPARCR